MSERSQQKINSIDLRGHKINWVREHYKGFWSKAEKGRWEPHTYRVIDRHVTEETIFLDFGSNIGAIALYAANIASKVLCFEPDPLSREMLLANIEVNPALANKILVIDKAVHSSGGQIQFGSQRKGGDSMSSSLLPDLKTTWIVESLTPDEINSMLPEKNVPVFIKIDVEGGEYDIVPAAAALLARDSTTVYLSTHQNVFEKYMSQVKIRWLTCKVFRALRRYDVRAVRKKRVRGNRRLSILHKLGLAAPLKYKDWLFTQRGK